MWYERSADGTVWQKLVIHKTFKGYLIANITHWQAILLNNYVTCQSKERLTANAEAASDINVLIDFTWWKTWHLLAQLCEEQYVTGTIRCEDGKQ